ncbi:YrbL family protein [Winogradskyella sp. UBA3174]|uniref:YrbL family protein n=1 Tax=Winogradskyella sp. UBA3174 TaxID=1947785 RepID=UPI0025DCDFC6|nr:YrbL family protein [Winogradskyella sp. UBA3174]|tara:strand:- start:19767 stop:20387 length:621 start_codon:yes stop_codon:yes gene_type:complete
MVQLNDSLYIAEGVARKCYHHPENTNLCIKIGKPEIAKDHLYKEINYYSKIQKKDTSQFSYPFYSKFRGEISTNLGTGFVYDLIKDEPSQKISLTLRHYLEMEDSPISDATIINELKRLKQQMIEHKVFVGDLRARNICVKILKDTSIQLIVIDGLGHRDFFPLADWFHHYAKKKVERRFIKSNLHSLEAQRILLKRLRAIGAKYI